MMAGCCWVSQNLSEGSECYGVPTSACCRTDILILSVLGVLPVVAHSQVPLWALPLVEGSCLIQSYIPYLETAHI